MEQKVSYPHNGNMITFKDKKISIKVIYPIAKVSFYEQNEE